MTLVSKHPSIRLLLSFVYEMTIKFHICNVYCVHVGANKFYLCDSN